MTKSKADSYVSVGKSDALRRISNVADGAADSDVATISQLRKAVEETDASKKANIDASNIGKNLKFKADGKTAADSTDITTNEDAWGAAIGTGEIKADDGRMVTGKTVYDEVRPTENGNYVKKDQTTGKNLSALDSKIGKLDETKKYNYIDSKESTSISDNLTKLDTQVKKNADDITNINKSIGTLDQNAVKYDNSNKSKVTLAGADGTTITNLKAGEVKDTSKDAVNGSQLYAEQNARTAADTKLTNDLAAETQARTDADTAINNKIGTLDKDGNYIKKDASVSSNLSTLDTQVKTTSDLIHTKGDTIQIGGSSTATKIDVRGKDKDGKSTGRIITGVVTDAADPTSAANVGYVNGVTAANTQQIYRDMNNAYGRLNNNINKAAAGSNALAALHPLDYDPDDKADFAVGYGHYRNANAAAVGAFYHPNENTMVNVGVSLGNGDPGFNAGVSFKVGRGGAGHEAMSKTEMAKVINSQSKEIDALKKDNADKDKRIDALEQKMAEILAKLNKNGK
ncbi:YadA C-terminal domain-containing protein [uncultured Dialister sp.]|uniref:YadA C-terminal domain-containing protein n=1 Tax=uncultured Dialister sp. TaxID=278064 RepID=UPI0026DD1518|nr:YadA-like family protein [uncultured Dialister sp.]